MPTPCGNTSIPSVTHEYDTEISATITSSPEATTGAAVTETPAPTSGAAVTSTPAPTTGAAVTSGPATTETPAPVDTIAVTASAISTKKVVFVFNNPVTASSITKDDVVVTETVSKERKFVKAVSADETNNKAVVIEFYDDLTSDKTYDIVVKLEGKEYTLSYAYTVGAPAKIVASAQTIPYDTATAIKYAVYDEKGVDITATTKVNFTSDRTITTDGKLTLNSTNKTAFVNITYTLPSGKTVESGQFIVTGEARKAASLTNYTVTDKTDAPDYKATDYKQNTTVYLKSGKDVFLHAQFKDQFDDVVKSETATLNFTSLDTTVAVVDKTSGLVTPLKAGTVPVKIEAVKGTDVQYSTTIQLTVAPASTIQAVKAADSSLTTYSGLTNPEVSTTVYTEDQYGTKGYTGLSHEVTTGKDLVTVTLDAKGKLTVKPIDSKKSGTAVIKVTYGSGDSALSTSIVVTLKAFGAVASYQVEGAKTVLDINTSTTETDANYKADQMTLSVNPVDANGDLAGNPENFTYQITTGAGIGVISGASVTEDGKTTATLQLKKSYDVFDKDGNKTGTTEFVKDETYNVVVKVGNLTVKNFVFTVKDTRVAPAVTVAKSSVTVSATSGAALKSTADLAELLQNAGVVTTDAKVIDVNFVSANTKVLSNEGKFTPGYDTAVTVVIKSVKVKDSKKAEFDVDVNAAIELTVSKKTDAELKLDAKKAAEAAIAEVETIAAQTEETENMKAAKTAIAAYKTAGATDNEVAALAGYTDKYLVAVKAVAKNAAETAIEAVITAAKAEGQNVTNAGSVSSTTVEKTSLTTGIDAAVKAYEEAYSDEESLTGYDVYQAVLAQVKANSIAAGLESSDIISNTTLANGVYLVKTFNGANLTYVEKSSWSESNLVFTNADSNTEAKIVASTAAVEGPKVLTVTVSVTVGSITKTKTVDFNVSSTNGTSDGFVVNIDKA